MTEAGRRKRNRKERREDRRQGHEGRGKPERAYARLTEGDRKGIERGLDDGDSCRKTAESIGRSPSTVHDEVMRHRFVTSPKARRGEPAPDGLSGACDRLGRWPRRRNGCKGRGGCGCDRRPKVRYDWGLAQRAADAEPSEAGRGVDESEPELARKCAPIDDRHGRGLSPEQIVNVYPGLGISKATVCDWTDGGCCGPEDIRLRRKAAHRPRSHAGGGRGRSTRHSGERSHDESLRLPEGVRDSAWGMDAAEGASEGRQCLLAPCHRPSGLQLAVPVAPQARRPGARRPGAREGRARRRGGHAARPRVRPDRQRDGALGRGRARRDVRRAAGRGQALLLRPEPRRAEGRVRALLKSR
ncbi:helix-turn-helix domain-containing protein [Olsenella sp. Marseille-P4559]|uniref:helix-turn-helix domain-containing protein n=1 Tax=Olsenella sp. Marseille-P4559 TaxID=2364795 RepID=UPI0013EF569A|nr:helix-turn-helix domain-containing protein [Olsenella sp. Marseille-P4559]